MNKEARPERSSARRSLGPTLTDKILGAAKETPFRAAVLEAVRLQQEANRVLRKGDARDEKLSARAYLNEALRNARTDTTKLRKLQQRLKGTDGHDMLDALIANAYARMVATRVDKGCDLRPPCQNLHLVVGIHKADMSTLLMEAMMAGTSPLECVALAALLATTDAPDAFGHIDDFDAHESRQKDQMLAFEAACRAIRDLATMNDFEMTPVDPTKSIYRMTFKWNNMDTGIGIGAADASQRLVSHAVVSDTTLSRASLPK